MVDRSFKLVVVGDGAVGKTSMLIAFATNTFPEDYVPTVFDNYSAKISYNDQVHVIGLWDTAGQDTYDSIRPLGYNDTDLFLVCFSIVHPPSLDNVKKKWVPEIRHYCPETPFILVGLKLDLIDDKNTLDALQSLNLEPVTTEKGMEFAKQLGAESYAECSAKTQYGVKELFEDAISIILRPPEPPKKKECLIL